MQKSKKTKEDNTEFEIKFYEDILEKRPNFITALKVLAELCTKTGRFQKGLELDKRLIGLLPYDSVVYYNLACSYSLLGDINASLESIKKAIELGYDDFNYLYQDPDLVNLRQDRRFEEILFKIPKANKNA